MSKNSGWPKETCTNCKQVSYTLAVEKRCPYCDKDWFVKKLVELKFWNEEKIKNSIKTYKINISNQELENIKLSVEAFNKQDK